MKEREGDTVPCHIHLFFYYYFVSLYSALHLFLWCFNIKSTMFFTKHYPHMKDSPKWMNSFENQKWMNSFEKQNTHSHRCPNKYLSSGQIETLTAVALCVQQAGFEVAYTLLRLMIWLWLKNIYIYTVSWWIAPPPLLPKRGPLGGVVTQWWLPPPPLVLLAHSLAVISMVPAPHTNGLLW